MMLHRSFADLGSPTAKAGPGISEHHKDTSCGTLMIAAHARHELEAPPVESRDTLIDVALRARREVGDSQDAGR